MQTHSDIIKHLSKTYKTKVNADQVSIIIKKCSNFFNKIYMDFYGYDKEFYISSVKNMEDSATKHYQDVEKTFMFSDDTIINSEKTKTHPMCTTKHSMGKTFLYIFNEGLENGLMRAVQPACVPPSKHETVEDITVNSALKNISEERMVILSKVTKKHSIWYMAMLMCLLDKEITLELPDSISNEVKKIREMKTPFVKQRLDDLRG